ncbi:hypothetical protein LINPERHAP1_LOCUS13478 [Linum perenne]
MATLSFRFGNSATAIGQ